MKRWTASIGPSFCSSTSYRNNLIVIILITINSLALTLYSCDGRNTSWVRICCYIISFVKRDQKWMCCGFWWQMCEMYANYVWESSHSLRCLLFAGFRISRTFFNWSIICFNSEFSVRSSSTMRWSEGLGHNMCSITGTANTTHELCPNVFSTDHWMCCQLNVNQVLERMCCECSEWELRVNANPMLANSDIEIKILLFLSLFLVPDHTIKVMISLSFICF
jgi:hypothetical protein